MSDRTLADVLDEYAHDGAFCGRMTKAGLPCQRERALKSYHCPRHNAIVEAARTLPSLVDAFNDALEEFAAAVSIFGEFSDRRERRRHIRERYIRFDPATEPPALPSGDGDR